jgi:ABC-2 type transport system permease protein
MARVMAGLMIFFVFYTAAYMATSILREDEDGTLQRLFAAPVERSGILGGKLLAVFLTITVQALVLIAASRVLFSTSWGAASSAGLALAGMVVAAGGFGSMLASFMKNVRQSGPVLGGGLSVAGMLGGLFTPAVPNMPAILGKVALVFPQGWVMRAWTLSVSGRGPGDIVVPFVVLLGLGAVCFSIGVLVFRRRFA